VRKAAAQKRFEALAHIWGDRISPQLLPQGDRLAVGLQEPPAILAVGNMHFKGVPEAWLEGIFKIIDNEVDHLLTPEHRWWPVSRGASSIGSGEPAPELPHELRPALHTEVFLRSTQYSGSAYRRHSRARWRRVLAVATVRSRMLAIS